MVKRAAHDSLDECSNHSSLKSPNAGIGRQDKLKLY